MARARRASCRQRRQPFAEPGSAGRERRAVRGVRALAVIDGEHYEPVVRDALAALPYQIVGVWLAGGTEKLRGGEASRAPGVAPLDAGAAGPGAAPVFDRPVGAVLGPRGGCRGAHRG